MRCCRTWKPAITNSTRKQRQVTLTEAGNEHMAELLQAGSLLEAGDLYDIDNITVLHHVNQALKAHKLFLEDRDYIVKNGEVIIIDEFTGRMMEGRRYSEGLHQALEAKENATIQPENVTLASITFQNYFRLYDKLAGMTGTAMTEAAEFMDIYKLDVIDIPTNMPVRATTTTTRSIAPSRKSTTRSSTLIKDCHKRGQPVLVGTTSIEKSEHALGIAQEAEGQAQRAERALSRTGSDDRVAGGRFGRRHHRHQHGRPRHRHPARRQCSRCASRTELGGIVDEAERAAADRRRSEPKSPPTRNARSAPAASMSSAPNATKAGASTISCAAVRAARAIPAPRNSSCRLQDDLMRIFGSQQMDAILQRLGLEKGEAISHPWVNKALEKAQQKVEARNFEIRKNILQIRQRAQ